MEGRAPGVYVEERTPAVAPVMATGVPLFIGFVQAGSRASMDAQARQEAPVRVRSWQQFEHDVPRGIPEGLLAYAVRGFFENGGMQCTVLPVPVNEEDRTAAALRQAIRRVFEKNVYRAEREWLRGVLDEIDDVDLVCVPDVMIDAIRQDEDDVFELQRHVLEYCRDWGERLAILDVCPGNPNDVSASVKSIVRHRQALLSTDGALYAPWVLVRALQGNGMEWVPPCGHIAGIYARSDARVGFHKAPANEIVDGVVDLELDISAAGRGELNDMGVNCLTSSPRRGIRVSGARTLSGHPQWRYVNVRRTSMTLVRWIHHNMDDVVFEPNGPALWDRVRERLRGFCHQLFEQGALRGVGADEAYFVKCDGELNPAAEQDAGRLVCEVGMAPLSPAEFIVVKVTRSAAGATTVVPVLA